MNLFLNNLKNIQHIKTADANREIIYNLMVKNLRGKEKLSDNLDAYDSESLFENKIYPGNLYIFTYYTPEHLMPCFCPSGHTFVFPEKIVVLYITHMFKDAIRGINFGLCPPLLRKLILNEIMGLDEEFYTTGIYNKIKNRNLPVSDLTQKFLLSGDDGWLNLFNKIGKADFKSMFLTYSVKYIQNIRLIEPWQWIYVPYIEYSQELDKTIKAVQKINGFYKWDI